MTQPIASVVRIATTPQQAKILVALLQADGIPATIEGDSLADEVAVSRRLLNLNGTRVMVPTQSLDRAKEVLASVQVEESELENQALAAENPEASVPRLPKSAPSRWPLAITTCTSVVLLGLWITRIDVEASTLDPRFRYEPTTNGMREFRRSDGELLRELEDLDKNGSYERISVFGKGTVSTSHDDDNDGLYERVEERLQDGTTTIWMDTNGDALFDQGVVRDSSGKELQRLQWTAGVGFTIQPR